ncbi:MAG: hypothetical protein J6X70_10635 [Muribaculaceae bacterium]|nr:hypothetical protein [Muribaculaceae bacterium]
MTENKNYLSLLITDVEDRIGRGLITHKDFEYLHDAIESQLKEQISMSTLKRIWGYTKYTSSPSASVLSILCRLVGYRDWNYYQSNRIDPENVPSATVLSDKIDVGHDLTAGDRLKITWSPQRVCEVIYHGNNEFEVVASQNTGIKVGDWFNCALIVAGEPLWLNNLRHPGKPAVAYVCGKLGGVSYSRIIESAQKTEGL